MLWLKLNGAQHALSSASTSDKTIKKDEYAQVEFGSNHNELSSTSWKPECTILGFSDKWAWKVDYQDNNVLVW